MTHTWKPLGLAAFLAVLFATLPLRAAEPEWKERLDKEIEKLRKDVDKYRKDSDSFRATALSELYQVNERLDRLEALIKDMNKRSSTRIAGSFTPDTPLTRGTVRLVNRLDVPATVTMNGVKYTVEPFDSLILRDQPTGAFRYSVLAAGFSARNVDSSLRNNETLTVTIHNPR
jgi:hypothetical protein